MKNNDQRSSLFWFAVGLAVAAASGKYGLGTPSAPGPGFLPFLTGLVMMGLAALVFFQQAGGRVKNGLTDLWSTKGWTAVVMVMGALVLYTLLLRTLGFLLDTFWLLAFLLRVMEPRSWGKTLIGAALASGGSYIIFQVWLQAQLPAGFLGF
jgi:hypothetical protein